MRWLKFTASGKTSWGLVEGDKVVAVAPVAEGEEVPEGGSPPGGNGKDGGGLAAAGGPAAASGSAGEDPTAEPGAGETKGIV
jgi:hypothetical protein